MRNVSDGMRLNWQAPYATARRAFENFIQLAKQLEKSTNDVIGYGLASKPISGAMQDSVRKAMLNVHSPAESGLKVEMDLSHLTDPRPGEDEAAVAVARARTAAAAAMPTPEDESEL
eukprot:6424082-Lingulodinium_polyedra.AAC.1